nr:hypothetical protein DA06_21265 [Georgenia sp. SUBG003]
MGAMLDGEAHVGDAELEEVTRPVLRVHQHPRKQVVTLGGDGGEEARLVTEVVGGCSVRHTRPAREVAHAEARRTGLGNRRHGRVEDGTSQVAVVIGPECAHGGMLRGI